MAKDDMFPVGTSWPWSSVPAAGGESPAQTWPPRRWKVARAEDGGGNWEPEVSQCGWCGQGGPRE